MTYNWFTSRFTRRPQEIDNAADISQREPLDHPELARMTMRELADLPMPAIRLKTAIKPWDAPNIPASASGAGRQCE